MSSSNNSLTSSPARSSISTTAIVGANATAAASLPVDDYHFPADLISIQDRKDEALQVLKTDVMVALNKVAKSLDEDSWMFDGPRSRMHLISRPGITAQKTIASNEPYMTLLGAGFGHLPVSVQQFPLSAPATWL